MLVWLRNEVWQPLWDAADGWQRDHGPALAASVSYYAAVSFFPFIMVLIAGLGYFLQFTGAGQDARATLLDFIADQWNQDTADQVQRVLADVEVNAPRNGPIGLATLLVAALAIFTQFEWAFDRIWKIEEQAKSWWDTIKSILFYRLKAFLMLAGSGLLIVISFLAGMTLSAISRMTDEAMAVPEWVWTAAQLLLALTLNTLLFTVILKALPRPKIHFADALRGGVLAAIIWEIGRQVLAAFLVGNRFNAYGIVGSFLAILLWIYYVASLIFFAAEYVQVLWRRRKLRTEEEARSGKRK